jgi:hypothetical protein
MLLTIGEKEAAVVKAGEIVEKTLRELEAAQAKVDGK